MKIKSYYLLLLLTFILFVSESSFAEERKVQNYIVQENETLAIIAFKIYGDYRKWKELLKFNPELSIAQAKLEKGKRIRFKTPEQVFKWRPLGEPYLVKKNDTLATISYALYNTHKRWNEIYQNNRQLIRDPDLILAGFTIYYIP